MTLDIHQIIKDVQAGTHMTREQTRDVFEQIMTGRVDPEPMGEFLKALAAKGETVEEIAGAADVMNDKVTRVPCDADCIDTCGTGGDGISTFNVSTTAAIIAAAAGAVVAKHGNRTNTRVSGSAEAIAALGVNLDADVDTMARCLRECRIAFLFAPNLHPAMKYAGPVRKTLGIRTIFNYLGPLTNPAGARRQVLGVPRPELTEMLARVLAARCVEHAWVVSGETGVPETPGLCDLTITGVTHVSEVKGGEIRHFTVQAEAFGLEPSPLDELIVESPQASAETVKAILNGCETGAPRNHALLNAGAALVIAGVAANLSEGVEKATCAVDAGGARQTLEHLIEQSNAS